MRNNLLTSLNFFYSLPGFNAYPIRQNGTLRYIAWAAPSSQRLYLLQQTKNTKAWELGMLYMTYTGIYAQFPYSVKALSEANLEFFITASQTADQSYIQDDAVYQTTFHLWMLKNSLQFDTQLPDEKT